jgi:hypothetical protein
MTSYQQQKQQKGNGLEIIDLSDDILAMIITELGIERTIDGAIIPHPHTLPYGPREKYDGPLKSSKDVPIYDSSYIGYGGIWRSSIACTIRRFAVITKATAASPWCAKMSHNLATARLLHAMRQPYFASTALVKNWLLEFIPSSTLITWHDATENSLYKSIVTLAKKGTIAHERIAVLAQLLLATFDLPGDRWMTRLYDLENTPSGSAVLQTIMEELFTTFRRLVDSDKMSTLKYINRLNSIFNDIKFAIAHSSYDDSFRWMRLPVEPKVAKKETLAVYVAKRTVMAKDIPDAARKRINWRKNLIADLETVERLNGFTSDASVSMHFP